MKETSRGTRCIPTAFLNSITRRRKNTVVCCLTRVPQFTKKKRGCHRSNAHQFTVVDHSRLSYLLTYCSLPPRAFPIKCRRNCLSMSTVERDACGPLDRRLSKLPRILRSSTAVGGRLIATRRRFRGGVSPIGSMSKRDWFADSSAGCRCRRWGLFQSEMAILPVIVCMHGTGDISRFVSRAPRNGAHWLKNASTHQTGHLAGTVVKQSTGGRAIFNLASRHLLLLEN